MMFDRDALLHPTVIFERFVLDMQRRCRDLSPISEDDMRYVFLHALEAVAKTDPFSVRLGHRIYQNDRLKMDLVVHTPGTHYFACEFKVQIGSYQRKQAWLVVNDLSRLALVSKQWGSTSNQCPSYFIYLHAAKALLGFRRDAPRLAKLLDVPIGTQVRFDVVNEVEIKLDEKHRRRPGFRTPPHELDIHSGVAESVVREVVGDGGCDLWHIAIFRVLGDEHYY